MSPDTLVPERAESAPWSALPSPGGISLPSPDLREALLRREVARLTAERNRLLDEQARREPQATEPVPASHAQLLARIAAKDAVIRALYASTSWSITAPIRALADLLRRTQPAALERVIAATDQLPAAPPMPELPGAASVRITRGRPRPGSLGEVLVVADHLPLFDQQSGGLRLQTLIGMIGELGWTITFGSFWPETGPGILATEEGRGRYETALRAAGVTDFAYGLEGIRQCLQEAGGRVRFALISFPTVAHEVMPLVRSYCP